MITINHLVAVNRLTCIIGIAVLQLGRCRNFKAFKKAWQPIIVITHNIHRYRLCAVFHYLIVNLLKGTPCIFRAHIGKITADYQCIHSLVFKHSKRIFKGLILMSILCICIRKLQITYNSYSQRRTIGFNCISFCGTKGLLLTETDCEIGTNRSSNNTCHSN